MYKRHHRGLLLLIAIAALFTLALHVSDSRATNSDPTVNEVIARRQAAADSTGQQNALRQVDKSRAGHKREHKRRQASDNRQSRRPTPTRDPLSEPVPTIDSQQ